MAERNVQVSRVKALVDDLWGTLASHIHIPDLAIKGEVGTPTISPLQVKAGLDAKIKLVQRPDVRKEVAQLFQNERLLFKEAVQRFVRESSELVREKELGSSLVVVLDGLEKVADTELDRIEREKAVREIFLNNADMLQVPCHVIFRSRRTCRHRKTDLPRTRRPSRSGECLAVARRPTICSPRIQCEGAQTAYLGLTTSAESLTTWISIMESLTGDPFNVHTVHTCRSSRGAIIGL